ncbi:H-NS histone family protein [Akkermansiaceae bacterium]|nr:H-NS histone family protein [Akkermansiaceae bacterium]
MNIDIEKLSIADRSDLMRQLEEKAAEDTSLYNEALDKVLAIADETGNKLEDFIRDLKDHASTKKKKGKRASSPSPTLVNPNDPSQTCKIKGKQPQWRKALKAGSDYQLSDHVKKSIPHLNEDDAKINEAWLSKQQTYDPATKKTYTK